MNDASAARYGRPLPTGDPSADDVSYIHDRVTSPDAWTRVVMVGDVLAGFAIGRADTLKILMVLPRYWGLGLGSGLISWAIESRRVAGQSNMLLWTQVDNDRAQRLYERHGFQQLTDTKIHERTGEPMVRYRLDLVPYAQALT
jgi:GNAT superfamily N-acetyltransferase